MVGASGQLYSVDFYGKRLLFCLVVVVVMMGVVTGVIQGHEFIQGHKQRGSVTISTSETSHSNTIGRHSRLLRGLGSTSELERESKANNHLQSSPVNDNDRMDTRADKTRDVCFPFVVMWIQRRQAAGYTAPDDDEGVGRPERKPPSLLQAGSGGARMAASWRDQGGHPTSPNGRCSFPGFAVAYQPRSHLRRGTEVVPRQVRQDSLRLWEDDHVPVAPIDMFSGRGILRCERMCRLSFWFHWQLGERWRVCVRWMV